MMNLYKYGTLALLVLIIAENSLNVNILHLSEMINAISSYFIGLMGFGHWKDANHCKGKSLQIIVTMIAINAP